jgi:hypothetical protein
VIYALALRQSDRRPSRQEERIKCPDAIDANIEALELNELRWWLLGILVEPLAFTP